MIVVDSLLIIVVVGSDTALAINSGIDTKLMSAGILLKEQKIEDIREELRQYAEPLCKEMHETEFPPLRDIDHTMLLIDKKKTYSWIVFKSKVRVTGK